MAYDDLHHYLERLESCGELHRVKAEVDPLLEIAEITGRVSKSPDGKALFFERVRGGTLPVVTNLFGSWRRMCAALSVSEPQQLTRRMEDLLGFSPTGALDSETLAPFVPRHVSSAPCGEVAESDAAAVISSTLKSWPRDGNGSDWPGGRFLTLPLVFTADAESGRSNCGMYRVELFDPHHCGIHWYPGSGGGGHYRNHEAAGKPMPVAISLGGDPALMLAAAMPLPETVDEVAFAGFLRDEPVDLVQCRTNGLMVPAGSEIVIEGIIEAGRMTRGGDFGNHTGWYSPGNRVPVMRIDCVTRRRDAVLPATVVGPPPMEDCFMGKAMERLMLPLLRQSVPEIVEINLPVEGIFHGAALVAIRKTRPWQGREVIERLWKSGWLAAARLLVILDEDVDPHDMSLAGWWTLNHADWQKDVIIAGKPAGKKPGTEQFGGRLGIDATRKLVPETAAGSAEELVPDRSVQETVTRRWREYGL